LGVNAVDDLVVAGVTVGLGEGETLHRFGGVDGITESVAETVDVFRRQRGQKTHERINNRIFVAGRAAAGDEVRNENDGIVEGGGGLGKRGSSGHGNKGEDSDGGDGKFRTRLRT
jgi:hypothetical protein